MRFGFALPQYDYSVPGESPLGWETVARWAAHAVAQGFTSLWVSDHLFLDIEKYGGAPGRYACLDAVVAMGALAAAPALTEARTTIGCLVFAAPLRPPRLLAKQLHTLDTLAPGRIVAGFGAGWYEPEFAAAGIPFEPPAARLRLLAETVEEVRDFFADHPERRPPLWVGGKGDRLLSEVVAPHADGWNTVWAWTPEDYAARLAVLHRACERHGRDPAGITLSIGLTALVGEDDADVRARFERLAAVTPKGVLDGTTLDEWRRGRLVGTVEHVREQVEEWRRLGVLLLVVNLGALPFSVTDTDALDLVASAVS
jgi:alkanesulfonate monooxygenase SsuD/methylene tetrahydromethanopterin reductase-like flavin-dependent oxidoreductase (luciferase family)